MKYKNPPIPKDIIGFDLYIDWSQPIVLCEGVFDAIAIKNNSIPLFGKTILPKLFEKILTKKVKHIIISLDSLRCYLGSFGPLSAGKLGPT